MHVATCASARRASTRGPCASFSVRFARLCAPRSRVLRVACPRAVRVPRFLCWELLLRVMTHLPVVPPPLLLGVASLRASGERGRRSPMSWAASQAILSWSSALPLGAEDSPPRRSPRHPASARSGTPGSRGRSSDRERNVSGPRRPKSPELLCVPTVPQLRSSGVCIQACRVVTWLRTDGVNTNGATAIVKMFDRLGTKVRPGTFGEIKVGEREYPKSPSVEKHDICSDPISADPICPFPRRKLGVSSPHGLRHRTCTPVCCTRCVYTLGRSVSAYVHGDSCKEYHCEHQYKWLLDLKQCRSRSRSRSRSSRIPPSLTPRQLPALAAYSRFP